MFHPSIRFHHNVQFHTALDIHFLSKGRIRWLHLPHDRSRILGALLPTQIKERSALGQEATLRSHVASVLASSSNTSLSGEHFWQEITKITVRSFGRRQEWSETWDQPRAFGPSCRSPRDRWQSKAMGRARFPIESAIILILILQFSCCDTNDPIDSI